MGLPEPGWQALFAAAAARVNFASGFMSHDMPRRFIDEPIALKILQMLVDRKYNPDPFFTVGVMPEVAVGGGAPVLDENLAYHVFRLNVLTQQGARVSMPVGGVVYEDPILALAAARLVGTGFMGKPRALPVAPTYQDVWNRRRSLFERLRDTHLSGGMMFEPGVGFTQRASAPVFDVVEISGRDLFRLRQNGAQAIRLSGSLMYVEIFKPASAPSLEMQTAENRREKPEFGEVNKGAPPKPKGFRL
ncbi:MAG TPA: hypothetical protein DCW68_01985 [Rhodospirillaceae bacterium]|nr:MAG: hypothetical protein A2018_04950 [Alphaproteobacteria bacterium GWF2_58_20]HAU28865.1 hypothetical protein [Rhodospirillaceae bacterium]